MSLLFERPQTMSLCELLGADRDDAAYLIVANHYTKSVPSGKSHYLALGSAIVVWSIPANCKIAAFLLGFPGSVWELSRLWAPDGHEKNLLTMAISKAARWIERRERPDALVSYADPNVGHGGGVYRAASWIFHGQSEESRMYTDGTRTLARRAFHSGSRGMTREQIEAAGFTQLKLAGKLRFVRPLTRRAKLALA